MKKNIGLELLRIICIFTVVIIHTPHLSQESWQKVLEWLPFANACFAFMSGMFLFKEGCELSVKYVIKKRIWRLLVPYGIWTCLYIVWGFCSRAIYGREIFPPAQRWVEIVFFGAAQGQLWFVIFLFYAQTILILIYSCLPSVGWVRLFFFSAIALLLFLIEGDVELPVLKKLFLIVKYCCLGVSWSILCRRIRSGFVKYVVAFNCFAILICAHIFKLHPALSVFSWVVLFQFSSIWITPKEDNSVIAVASCTMGIYYIHHMVPAYLIYKVLPFARKVICYDAILLLFTSLFIYMVSLAAVYNCKKIKRLSVVWGE